MAHREQEVRQAGDLLVPNAHLAPVTSSPQENRMTEERTRIIGGGGTGVRARVDIRAACGDEKEWNVGGQDDSPGKGVVEGALGTANERHHDIVSRCL